MNALHQHIARVLAGEPMPHHTNKELPALLAEIRSTIRNPKALKALGLVTLTQVSAGLKSSLHTEKALMRAQGDRP